MEKSPMWKVAHEKSENLEIIADGNLGSDL